MIHVSILERLLFDGRVSYHIVVKYAKKWPWKNLRVLHRTPKNCEAADLAVSVAQFSSESVSRKIEMIVILFMPEESITCFAYRPTRVLVNAKFSHTNYDIAMIKCNFVLLKLEQQKVLCGQVHDSDRAPDGRQSDAHIFAG